MIILRRSAERHPERRRKQEVWDTFHPGDSSDALASGFGTLELLSEDRLPPGAGVSRHPHRDAEIVTYVREGALAHEDSLGISGVIHAGEFQRMTAGRGLEHSERNASRADWAHVFQLHLRSSQESLSPSHEQRRFSAAQRRGLLCVVASSDARCGSLKIHQEALVFSSLLHRGQHLVHELLLGRAAWLHVVAGEVTLGDLVLSTGDGAGLTAERAVSLTAREEAELLLVELAAPSSQFNHAGGVQ